MRTPTENAFGSKYTPFSCRAAKVSRAEWPIAATARSQGISPAAVRTARSTPFSAEMPVSAVRKCTSPPFCRMARRISRTTFFKISVPTWGLAFLTMSAGAPCAARVSSTLSHSGSPMRVVSLPSEYAPAPPSPNWMLQSGSSAPPPQKASTAASRSSRLPPRSSTTGA